MPTPSPAGFRASLSSGRGEPLHSVPAQFMPRLGYVEIFAKRPLSEDFLLLEKN